MKNYNLFLDDERNPKDVLNYSDNQIYIQVPWFIVRNYEQFCSTIKEKGIPNMVSFDHDIADFRQIGRYKETIELTGYNCAKWLIDYCMDHNLELPKTILIHSKNNVGVKNIESLFKTYNKVYGK